MKRLQAWEPIYTDPGYRFVTEWDDDEPTAPHVCISATLNGEPIEDPQGAYEAAVTRCQEADQ